MGTGMMKTLVVPQSVAPKRRTSSQWCLRLRRLCWCVIPFPAPPPRILHHHGIRLWPCLGWVEDDQYIWILPSFLVVIFIRFSSSFSFSSMHAWCICPSEDCVNASNRMCARILSWIFDPQSNNFLF
uniref:Uncharacterized protein n=1 Tax=Triticum urartu TaxID=4572 RepID=A0A8R7TXV4_TRIUA